jgi:hypothetical protein
VTVFVDQTAEDLGSPNGALAAVAIDGDVNGGWLLVESSVRAMSVVVHLVLSENPHQVPLAEDQPAVWHSRRMELTQHSA